MDRTALIEQLKKDEGFRSKAIWDNKQYSYGYGCRAPAAGATITEPDAAKLLEQHVDSAIADFNKIFKNDLAKFDDVRANAFANMIFNMGPGHPGDSGSGGLQSFINTLNLIFKNREVPWGQVADNLKKSLWFRQVKDSGDDDGPGPDKGRGERIVEEVRTGIKA